MFEFDPNAWYMMPAHFGPRTGKGGGMYWNSSGITVTYLTDRATLARYFPQPVEVGEEPLVTVRCLQSNEIDWLAGGAYNLIDVQASAVFHGEVDHVVGGYSLVLWENLTDPILTGRELQGLPKIYADIPDLTIFEGEWSNCASYRGHKIVDVSVRDLEPVHQDEIDGLSPTIMWIGWRYVPNVGGTGAAISHATLYPPHRFLPKEMWRGKGKVEWHHLTWEQNPTQYHIVNALAELPILEYRSAYVYRNAYSDPNCPTHPPKALQ